MKERWLKLMKWPFKKWPLKKGWRELMKWCFVCIAFFGVILVGVDGLAGLFVDFGVGGCWART